MNVYTTMQSPVGELLLVGGMRGYAGGVQRKQQLLVHEGALLGASW
jgi:hypothetical protein